jgi:hypothetical protein
MTRCADCIYFTDGGNCRRYPPVAVLSEQGVVSRTIYPVVTSSDWCGEFTFDLELLVDESEEPHT